MTCFQPRDHRKPPMPRWRGAGTCKWCDQDILHPKTHKAAGELNRRRNWHADCVGLYLVATQSRAQINAIKKRGDSKCADCLRPLYEELERPGKTPTRRLLLEWQADHKIPLWEVPRGVELADRHLYWGAENLQPLCVRCHQDKSRDEEARRALARRK